MNLFFHNFRGMLMLVLFVILLCITFESYTNVFDCEGPSGEAMQLERDHWNRENEKAYERCQEREKDNKDRDRSDNDRNTSRDNERANQYLRDNLAMDTISIFSS